MGSLKDQNMMAYYRIKSSCWDLLYIGILYNGNLKIVGVFVHVFKSKLTIV